MTTDRTACWHRNAGARRWHTDAPDWTRTGRALCGADISRPWMYRVGPPPEPAHEQLAHYPRTYGDTRACARCVRTLARGEAR